MNFIWGVAVVRNLLKLQNWLVAVLLCKLEYRQVQQEPCEATLPVGPSGRHYKVVVSVELAIPPVSLHKNSSSDWITAEHATTQTWIKVPPISLRFLNKTDTFDNKDEKETHSMTVVGRVGEPNERSAHGPQRQLPTETTDNETPPQQITWLICLWVIHLYLQETFNQEDSLDHQNKMNSD